MGKRSCPQTKLSFFHVWGKMNRHNVRTWGSENPHMVIEHISDNPKVNLWCGLLRDCLVGRFFVKDAVTSTIYVYMLEGFVFPQIEDLQPNIFNRMALPFIGPESFKPS